MTPSKTTSQPGQVRIEPLLDEVIKKKASDLHLQVSLPPMLRIDDNQLGMLLFLL